MNTVRTKLEAALKSYVASNFQDPGSALEDAQLFEAMRSGSLSDDAEHRVVFKSLTQGGPHARQGNYEVEVELHIVTNGNEQSTETANSRRLLHEERVEELGGIFSEGEVATVTEALTAIDPELGCSSYWGFDRFDEDDVENFRTVLRKTFEVFLIHQTRETLEDGTEVTLEDGSPATLEGAI